MKTRIKLLSVVVFTSSIFSCIAQTPYDDYAPSIKKREMLKLPEAIFRAYNVDTTKEVKYIELDKELLVLNYFDKNGRIIKTSYLNPNEPKWWVVDPKAAKYPDASPYNFVNNNPIINIDPNGQDWFKYKQEGAKEESWNWNDGSEYKLKTGVDEKGADVFKTIKGEKAVIVFNGRNDEKLGAGHNLFGKGAVLATVTVYGDNGPDDIKTYQGYSMGSDPSKFGAIADGNYRFNFDAKGKSGKLKSNWAVENRGRVPALGGYNPNPNVIGGDRAYKTGIFIHSSNQNGYAGTYNEGENGISEGCLLICPTQKDIYGQVIQKGFDQFNEQLKGVQNGVLELNRK